VTTGDVEQFIDKVRKVGGERILYCALGNERYPTTLTACESLEFSTRDRLRSRFSYRHPTSLAFSSTSRLDLSTAWLLDSPPRWSRGLPRRDVRQQRARPIEASLPSPRATGWFGAGKQLVGEAVGSTNHLCSDDLARRTSSAVDCIPLEVHRSRPSIPKRLRRRSLKPLGRVQTGQGCLNEEKVRAYVSQSPCSASKEVEAIVRPFSGPPPPLASDPSPG
jgi:hypothetical protein